MSNVTGVVRFTGGLILFYEYGGTCDVCNTALWETPEEVGAAWRSAANQRDCTCGPVAVHEPVRIYSPYGDGHHWDGLACRACKALVDGLQPSFGYPNNDNYEDGEPDWSPFIKWREESEAEHRARPARPKGLSGNAKDRRRQRRARQSGDTKCSKEIKPDTCPYCDSPYTIRARGCQSNCAASEKVKELIREALEEGQ